MQNHAEPPARKGGRPRTEHEEYIVWAHESGDTARQIAETCDTPIRTVYAVLERHGLTKPRRSHMAQPLHVLDSYDGATVVDPGRMMAIATISAGYKNDQGFPVVSRDGTIYLHDPNGQAPGLAAKLKEAGGKRLTIALLHEPEQGGLAQRYTRYSKTTVEAFGDEAGITVLEPKGRRVVAPGDPDWEAVRRSCKVEGRIFFALAEWDGQDARILFPDGFGVYCLRFTSRNSLRNFVAQANLIRRATGGRLVGIPLDISIVYQDVANPEGKRQKVPVWSFVMRPPGALSIGSGMVAKALAAGVREAEALALPGVLPPDPDDYTDVVTVVDLDEDAERQILEGAVDADSVRNQFFAATAGTVLAEKEGRAAFIAGWCAENAVQPTESLRELLDRISAPDAAKFLEDAERTALALRQADGPPEPEQEPEPEEEFAPQGDPGDEDPVGVHLTDAQKVQARAWLKKQGIDVKALDGRSQAYVNACIAKRIPALRTAYCAKQSGVTSYDGLMGYVEHLDVVG